MRTYDKYGALLVAQDTTSSSGVLQTGSDGRMYVWNGSIMFAGGDDLFYELIVQNQGGGRSLGLSDTGIASIPATSGVDLEVVLRGGTDGRTYVWNSADFYEGGDDKFYELIVQNQGGLHSLGLGDIGFTDVP